MVATRTVRGKKSIKVRAKKRKTTKRSRSGQQTAGGALQTARKARVAVGRSRPPKGKTQAKRQKPGDGAAVLWAALKKDDGCAAVLIVGEQIGGLRDDTTASCRVPAVKRGVRRIGREVGGKEGRVGGLSAPRACRAFAALGHTQRARMLGKLLEGPATYQALQRLTKLKAGPLYHHINQMRMAGLILPKQRDLYELTRGGRNLILAAIVGVPLIGDTRRRPLPAG